VQALAAHCNLAVDELAQCARAVRLLEALLASTFARVFFWSNGFWRDRGDVVMAVELLFATLESGSVAVTCAVFSSVPEASVTLATIVISACAPLTIVPRSHVNVPAVSWQASPCEGVAPVSVTAGGQRVFDGDVVGG